MFPDYMKGEFIIENFSTVKEIKETIYSDPLTSYGVTWRLKVYPNGNGSARGNFLSVFLEMVKGYSTPAKYDYKLEMENCLDKDLNISREYTSEFVVGECWGYNRFWNSISVQEENFIDREDKLKLKFYVRASSFAQQSSDQEKYIDKLESMIAILKCRLLSHNIKFSDNEEKEELERDDEGDKNFDKLPINDSNIERNPNSSCGEEEEEHESHRNKKGKMFHNDEVEFDKESNLSSDSQTKDIDKIENDSDEDDDHCPGSSLRIEERKQIIQDNLSQTSEEIESKIDEFRQALGRNWISQDIFPSNQGSLANSNILLDDEEIEPVRSSNNVNFEDFMKEISESESHIQKLKMYNNSFKGEMSAKYQGYKIDWDEESDNGNYSNNNEDDRSNTSDGNLSREEEQKVADRFVKDSIKKHLIDVSPESPLRVLSRCTQNDEKLYEEILLRNVLDEYADDIVNNSMMANQMDQRKRDISVNSMNRNSHKLTPEGKVLPQRKATWKKSPPKDEN
jgi:hypothetical protein